MVYLTNGADVSKSKKNFSGSFVGSYFPALRKYRSAVQNHPVIQKFQNALEVSLCVKFIRKSNDTRGSPIASTSRNSQRTEFTSFGPQRQMSTALTGKSFVYDTMKAAIDQFLQPLSTRLKAYRKTQ
ncbi:hypothetical protein TcG_09534 [Trypanosoma cruzi]|nr:hypothetical protein TcG_09534 [Trypanosoma cruzi]